MSDAAATLHGHDSSHADHAHDPVPPGKVGIWLFLASEIMFFIGILGSYIVFRAASPDLFARHAAALSKAMAGANTVVLLFSSLTMALAVQASKHKQPGKTATFLFLTFLCACGFMVIKSFEYTAKWNHVTVVAHEPVKDAAGKVTGQTIWVYDGHVHERGEDRLVIEGWRMPHPGADFDIHLASELDVEEGGQAAGMKEAQEFTIPTANINQSIQYMPWKNIFYACYFATTGVHGIHVLGGMLPIFFLMVFALRGKTLPAHTEYVGLYWHFVDLVWIFLFPLLYLI